MTIRCLLHDVVFSAEGLPSGMARECPVCLKNELNQARIDLEKARKDRDILIAAIELKRASLITPA